MSSDKVADILDNRYGIAVRIGLRCVCWQFDFVSWRMSMSNTIARYAVTIFSLSAIEQPSGLNKLIDPQIDLGHSSD